MTRSIVQAAAELLKHLYCYQRDTLIYWKGENEIGKDNYLFYKYQSP